MRGQLIPKLRLHVSSRVIGNVKELRRMRGSHDLGNHPTHISGAETERYALTSSSDGPPSRPARSLLSVTFDLASAAMT